MLVKNKNSFCKRNPTDLKILKAIFDLYCKDFGESINIDSPDNSKKYVYVPIDCWKVAKKLKADPHMVFGRLYYHLDNKHGYKRNNTLVSLFALEIDGARHVVNFPLLAAVLADLKEDKCRYNFSVWISIISLVIAALTFGYSIT
jgi:hypothetical protein